MVIAGLCNSLGSRKAARHGEKEILNVFTKRPMQQSPLVFRALLGKGLVVVGAVKSTLLLALRRAGVLDAIELIQDYDLSQSCTKSRERELYGKQKCL